jgi:hypothetical protein
MVKFERFGPDSEILLAASDAPSYWFTLNTSCDHAFHMSKRLHMDEFDYKALPIAGKLARYKRGAFMIIIEQNSSCYCLMRHRTGSP